MADQTKTDGVVDEAAQIDPAAKTDAQINAPAKMVADAAAAEKPAAALEPVQAQQPEANAALDDAEREAADRVAEAEHIARVVDEDSSRPEAVAMLKAIIRKNALWLLREMQLLEGGHDEARRAELNP